MKDWKTFVQDSFKLLASTVTRFHIWEQDPKRGVHIEEYNSYDIALIGAGRALIALCYRTMRGYTYYDLRVVDTDLANSFPTRESRTC